MSDKKTKARLVSAISGGELLGREGKEQVPAIGEVFWDYRISGRTIGYRIVDQKDGKKSVCLIGRFAAQNLQTGEQLVSGEFFPPNAAAKLIRAELDGRKDDTDAIDILLDIGREGCKVEDSPTRYTWIVSNVRETKDANLELLASAPLPPSRPTPKA